MNKIALEYTNTSEIEAKPVKIGKCKITEISI